MNQRFALPLTAALGGAAAWVLRLLQNHTGFETDTGLPIPGNLAALALAVLLIGLALALALTARLLPAEEEPGPVLPRDFSTENTGLLTIPMCGVFLLILSGLSDLTESLAVLPEGLVSIGYSAFWKTYHLKKIRFPTTLKKIGEDAFDGSGIESVSLKYVKKVGSGAFSGTKLKHVTIPAGTSFGSYAFCGCDELKSVRIEAGVKSISRSMFSRSGLRTITIPASVTEIGEHAFFAFSLEEGKLKKVTIRSTRIKKWGKEIFGKARKDLVIRVPKRKKKEYTKALRKGGLPEYVKIVGM